VVDSSARSRSNTPLDGGVPSPQPVLATPGACRGPPGGATRRTTVRGHTAANATIRAGSRARRDRRPRARAPPVAVCPGTVGGGALTLRRGPTDRRPALASDRRQALTWGGRSRRLVRGASVVRRPSVTGGDPLTRLRPRAASCGRLGCSAWARERWPCADPWRSCIGLGRATTRHTPPTGGSAPHAHTRATLTRCACSWRWSRPTTSSTRWPRSTAHPTPGCAGPPATSGTSPSASSATCPTRPPWPPPSTRRRFRPPPARPRRPR
jgi:hypothetical protein